MPSSIKQANDRLVGNFGSFILSAGTYNSFDFHIGAIVGGENGATITSITLEERGDYGNATAKEYHYANGIFDWDGKNLGAGEICEIPADYRVKTLVVTDIVKVILSESVELIEKL